MIKPRGDHLIKQIHPKSNSYNQWTHAASSLQWGHTGLPGTKGSGCHCRRETRWALGPPVATRKAGRAGPRSCSGQVLVDACDRLACGLLHGGRHRGLLAFCLGRAFLQGRVLQLSNTCLINIGPQWWNHGMEDHVESTWIQQDPWWFWGIV